MDLTIGETIQSLHSTLRDYIEATYHISDPMLIAQRRELLNAPGVIHQQPFLESTPRYESGPRFAELGLAPSILEAFTAVSSPSGELKTLIHDPPYRHQADAVRMSLVDGKSLMVMTGTGSGKTESFLLPILGKLAREASSKGTKFGVTSAVRCLVMYPMNALVNDQLGRLRLLFSDPRITDMFINWSGRPARFARYTSRTPYPGVRNRRKDPQRLKSIGDFYVAQLEVASGPASEEQKFAEEMVRELQQRGKWPAKPNLASWYGAKNSRWQDTKTGKFLRAVAHPHEPELITRHEVQEQPSDILITNYSMLEYMLMRPLERSIFDQTREWLENNPDESFLLVLDEAHLYRGAAGTEVALLIRRLRMRLGIPPERLQVICTSASFGDTTTVTDFGAQLTGKKKSEFEAIGGTLDLKDGASPGLISDAEALLKIDVGAIYEADTETDRLQEIEPFLTHRGVETSVPVESAVYHALVEFPPMAEIINITMGNAQPIHELGSRIFPKVTEKQAARALTTLITLASIARLNSNDPSLLPCRIHAFYRGLAGLWICMDPECIGLSTEQRGGPGGKLFSQPRDACDDCGARVLELFTCRNCGSAYGRAYTDDVDEVEFLWAEPGETIRAHEGVHEELEPLDLLLEAPNIDEVEPADYDLVTGRLNPHELGPRTRRVHLKNNRLGPNGNSNSSANVKPGEFVPCGVCGEQAGFGRSSVQDHQTKGDEPFQALIKRQLQVQPPNLVSSTKFAPLRGRKVLVFSDSRQTAARLAPNLQTYSTRDALRPLMIAGINRLQQIPLLSKLLSLEDLYFAVLVAANELGVRLRPELQTGENFSMFAEVARALDDGALDSEMGALTLFNDVRSAPPPQSLLMDMKTVLSHRYLGLESLALASIIESPKHKTSITSLPDISQVAVNPDQKLALARAWLRKWNTPRVGIWLSRMPSGWWQNEVRGHSGKFQAFNKVLNDRAAANVFHHDWLPSLLTWFTEKMSTNVHRLKGSELTLFIGGDWSYCGSCRTTQRPLPGSVMCLNCGRATAKGINPDTNPVFVARKGYYRFDTINAMKSPATQPMAIIAAEHTAQLNDSQAQDVFSKAEENELLFQDVNIGPDDKGQDRFAIDVLSSTTTMEVGIDIGTLTGVALRNMPPARANYQQRSGRAGRRANAVATVVTFGSADSHDEHYFSNPHEMISGKVDDPSLILDNSDIAKRHITAYLLQRYHQERLPAIKPEDQPQLFAVLGTVSDFKDGSGVLNRDDFSEWLTSTETDLKDEVDTWLPVEISDRSDLLENLISSTMKAIDGAIMEESDSASSNEDRHSFPLDDQDIDHEAGIQVEVGVENPDNDPHKELLLDRFLYKGILPRYAFPTDVATFHVFDQDKSTRYRHAYQFTPSQGLPVALSQYAPGKGVWVGGKEWISGALYAPMRNELYNAWTQRKLYYECNACNFARTEELDNGERGQLLDCPACSSPRTFGEARYWLRPPGFAHRIEDDPRIAVDDQPVKSYTTRAKLANPTPTEDGKWLVINSKIRVYTSHEHLLVTNRGPREEGYRYCTKCGLIEPTAVPVGKVDKDHRKPYPDDRNQNCEGGGTTTGIVLGTDFITDIALISIKVDPPVSLKPGLLSTTSALRTLCEALVQAGTTKLGLDPGELQAEFRPALTESGGTDQEAEIYIYDTLPGGAGFARRIAETGLQLFEDALTILETCGENCDRSCYRCLRSYKNKFDHDVLDRHLGASLLRHLISGEQPEIPEERLERSTDVLFQDLIRQQNAGLTFQRNFVVVAPGLPQATVPIHVTRESDGAEFVICLHSPLTPDHLTNQALRGLKEYSTTVVVLPPMDELIVRRNLPYATKSLIEKIR